MKNLKSSKHLTLDKLPIVTKESNNAPAKVSEKQIIITEISTSTKMAEIALKVAFKLVPSKTAFSKIQFDLFFNNQQISSKSIRILQDPLANKDFELTPALDMKGIPLGTYTVKVEMYELWSTGERFFQAKKRINCGLCTSNARIQIRQSPNRKKCCRDRPICYFRIGKKHLQ